MNNSELFFFLRPQWTSTAPATVEITDIGSRAWAVIYDVAGTTQLGVLNNVIGASTRKGIDVIGGFQLSVPAIDANAALVQVGREIAIYYEGQGVRFYGLIEATDESVDAQGNAIMRIAGASLAAELLYENTYVGLAADELTPQAALELLLAGVSWSDLVSGTYDNTVTMQFVYMSLWEAALKVAQMANGYLRETTTPRELEMKNNHASSGIVLTNLHARGVDIHETAGNVAPIVSIPRYGQEGRDLYNRIIPMGKAAGNDNLTLRDSTRVAPYSIQTKVTGPARITAVASAISSVPALGSTSAKAHEVEIESTGENRMIVVWAATNSTGNNLYGALLDDVWLPQVDWHDRATGNAALFFVRNPKKGRNVVRVKSDGSGVVEARVIAIALENASQETNPFSNSDGLWDTDPEEALESAHTLTSGIQSASSGSVNLSPDSAADDIVLSFVHRASGTADPKAGQTQLADYDSDVLVTASWEPGEAGSTTGGYDFSASIGYLYMALSVKPAKTYYIEDATSIADRRLRVKVLTDLDFSAFGFDEGVKAANSLYDAAVDFLGKHKDPAEFFDVDVAFFPGAPPSVGDTVRIVFRGFVEDTDGNRLWKDVDRTVVLLGLTESWDRDGVRSWKLELSTVLRWPVTDSAIGGDLVGSVGRLGQSLAVA